MKPSAAGSGAGPGARTEPLPDEVALAFHTRTLGQLLLVRSQLRLDDRTDRFLAGALVGVLHGKTPSYLSTIMPNTFSMAPRYVRDFAARTGFASPERDLFALLGAKLRRLARDGRPATRGALPVTSSSAWGFVFCGMRLEPVVKAPGRATKPYSGPAKWTSRPAHPTSRVMVSRRVAPSTRASCRNRHAVCGAAGTAQPLAWRA